MQTTSGGYISRLDHLRFVAAFMVFHWHFAVFNSLSHTDIPSFWPLSLLREGHTGVAFFMAISCYIFSVMSIGHTIDYKEFIRNRLYRIAPLFLVWITLYFYFWKIDPFKLLAAVFFFLNPNVVPANGWSVIVEFQCYLILPFLIIFLNRYGLRYLLGLLVLSIALKAGVWLQNGTVQSISYSTIFGRIDQFLCGMIAARLAQHVQFVRLRKTLPWLLLGVALSGLIYTYHYFHTTGGYMDGTAAGESKRPLWILLPALEGLWYGAFVAAYLHLDLSIPKWLDRCLARLGEVSYSLYLCHAFVLVIVSRFLIDYLGFTIDSYDKELIYGSLLVLPICLGVVFFTYHLIEVPFLQFRRVYLKKIPSTRVSSSAVLQS